MVELKMESWAIGIDLGTAHTRAAIFRNDKVEIIPDISGNRRMPSCISACEHQRGGSSSFTACQPQDLSKTIFNVKALLGRQPKSPEVTRALALEHCPSLVLEDREQPYLRNKHTDEAITVSEILSLILLEARKNAERYLKCQVYDAVVSLPGWCAAVERRLIRDAGIIAGINILHTVTGPSAVATRLIHREKRNVLIHDLGAGKLDVAVVEMNGEKATVKAIESNHNLGGVEFIDKIVEYQIQFIESKWKTNVRESQTARRKLWEACERAMWALSNSEHTVIVVPSLLNDPHFTQTFTRKFTRGDLTTICGALFKMIPQHVTAVLGSARLRTSDIAEICLVGGCSRIPEVRQLVVSCFKNKPKLWADPGDDIEVAGSAMIAALYSSKDHHCPSLSSLSLSEVASSMISLAYRSSFLGTIISQNDGIPVTTSLTLDVTPEVRYLTVFGHRLVGVYQDAHHHQELARIELEPLQLSFHEGSKAEIFCMIVVESNNQEAWCTLANLAGGQSITRLLGVRTSQMRRELTKIIERSTAYDSHAYSKAETITIRDHLDSRTRVLESMLTGLIPSSEVKELLGMVKSLRTWVNDSRASGVCQARIHQKHLQHLQEWVTTLYRQEIQGHVLLEKNTRMQPASDGLTQVRPTEFDMKTSKSSVHKLDISEKVGTQYDNKGTAISATIPTLNSSPTIRSLKGPKHQNPPKGAEKLLKSQEPEIEPTAPQNEVNELDSPSHSTNAYAHSSDAMEALGVGDSAIKEQGLEIEEEFDMDPLSALFSTSRSEPQSHFTDSEFERISDFLRNNGQGVWSRIPRLYAVLRLINKLDDIECFISCHITDIWFPFTAKTLPTMLRPSTISRFLETQSVVLSKGFNLEKGAGSSLRHAFFFKNEAVPFVVKAHLGRGAHGIVEKVMSTISHREYARKKFRKVRAPREDFKNFITELDVLKRVDHQHCVQLLGSYSDPRYFALIMEPVGDCDLVEYYRRAKEDPDKLSLLRTFFGCLANALNYLHMTHIRHRDIKPHNIIVKNGRVLITDFGIAYSWENLSRGTTTANSSRTERYAAPEVMRIGEPRGESADTWSLGCVFLEMTTVLKGDTVEEMQTFFEARSDSRCFYANQDAIEVWITQLRGKPPKEDNAPLDWVTSMLCHDRNSRVTVGKLLEDIIAESMRSRRAFCCQDCEDHDTDSTDEEDDTYSWGDDI